ncbi:MAG: 2-hydroxychromene-2-carboxylate isomerase [Marinibacterium sp.]|nr:2-hydroxychromene-2-carboxylate isomerase [Marinibacterium sp.]
MPVIEFLYDFGSPNTYLVHKVLPEIAARHGVGLRYVPILLGGVFKATNNRPPMIAYRDVEPKLAYQRIEFQRFVERHGLRFHMNPHFPVSTLGAMRAGAYALDKPWETRFIDAMFDAMWIHGQKLDDGEVLLQVLQDADLPGPEILQAMSTDEVKTTLITSTEQAVARGAFGSPTMLLGDEIFFGKDSLGDLEWILSRG